MVDGAWDKMRDHTAEVAGANKLLSTPLGALVERTVAGLGYELVDLERAAHGLLRVTLDVASGESGAPTVGRAQTVGIDDCERVSRQLTHVFAVEGIDYERLEVSSPGIDRPIRGARDFARFAGAMAQVQLVAPRDGRRRFRGRLLGLTAGDGTAQRVRMALVPAAQPPARGAHKARAPQLPAGETVEFALSDVEKARLVPEWEFDRGALQRSAQLRGK